jgi:cell division transport system permease protein
MKMLRQLLATDIPFARDDAHRLLPVMVACLIAFAALLFSVAISISHTLDGQSRAALGSLQVEVPRSKAADATLMGSITAEIKRTSGVREAKIITTEEMNTLLKPWLGEDIALEELSVPVMIDVITEVDAGKTTVDVDGLRRALRKFDSNIRVDDRGPWAVQVTQATSLVQALMIFIALLLVTCVIAMIVLLAKTSLRLHFKTVSLLHMFGATDEYILRQFQYNSAWLAARGGAAGALAAALIFTVMAMLSVQWHSPLVPEISLSIGHGVMLVILPIFTALVALVATRLTVQSMLEHMH